MCSKYNWKYVEYSEIGTSDSIDLRPEMLRLLADVEAGDYDAVLVVDYDRLGRGELDDQARIKKVFSKSDTLIITPNKVYNLNNDDDDFFSDVQGVFARQEYRMIKKRLRRGKREGSKLGKWTNGVPPTPYTYDQMNRQLAVDEEQYKVYRYIIDSALAGTGTCEIAWDLNKQGIHTRKGNMWSSTTIYRILVDETHLGKIVSNKSQGSGHKVQRPSANDFKIKPKSEWIVVNNCHKAVKTQEEHDNILYLLQSRKKIPTAARAGKHPLSGIIRCGVCGYLMQVQKKPNPDKDQVKRCQHHSPFGEVCKNRGGPVKPVFDYILNQINEFEKEIMNSLEKDEGVDIVHLSSLIKVKLKEIGKKEGALERIDEAFESGAYDLQKRNERYDKVKREIDKLEEELTILESRLRNASNMTNEERLQRIEEFRNTITNQKIPEEINKLYKTIISDITWKRLGDNDPVVHVNFL